MELNASQEMGKVTKLEIASTIGGKWRMFDSVTGRLVWRETKRGEKLEMNS